MALLPDLDTRTVLNVVEENFERIGLKAYAIRMIYTGEHALNKEQMINLFQETVNGANSCYCDISVRGLLLVYDSYFVHVVEISDNKRNRGTEETIRPNLYLQFRHPSSYRLGSTLLNIRNRLIRVVTTRPFVPQYMLYRREFLYYESNVTRITLDLGSEDTVHRHLRFLFEGERKRIEEKLKEEEESYEAAEGVAEILDEEHTEKPEKIIFKRAKLLMVYHSIQTFLLDDWRALTARPPSLIGKLDVHGPMSEHMEQLRICLDKIKRICAYAKADENLSFEGLSAVDPKMEALPEVALIDYLLQSQYILDLRHVVHLHRRVDDYAFYFENVWPLPTHFTPRHLYKLKIDDSFVEPLPVMPWELVKKEVEDEEREERQSGSDSSD